MAAMMLMPISCTLIGLQHQQLYICNSYTMSSVLPDIYAQARGRVHIYRQSTSAHGITNMFTHLIDKIFSYYTLLLYREPSKL